MAKWVKMYVGMTSVHYSVVDEEGKEVFEGQEPFETTMTGDVARAAIRASWAALNWAQNHGGVQGLDITGL